ncbi:uncharacterized protein (DUF1015 family) [Pedobacter cryoconitis]|uniref:Uncharacterized protein (DUF1015 family) n=1 Tax=Pedobacter cryoconitis TaxID=188932 RepID=A0A7W9E297_9SPHI|nr:DUF1015 family protein [Pedobacter cryoconitis]MBB5638530.1 uncharacterized protein (DUF1015 family) [Pedobacter cryoconitis]
MATIRPFVALRPQEVYLDKMLSLKAPSCNGRGNGFIARMLDKGHSGDQGLTNANILANLKRMIRSGDFYQEEHPCIFIYEITQGNHVQTGVWAVTDLDDFDRGHIKTHESTADCNSSGLIDYRDEVGLEGGPLLITYRPNRAISSILNQIKKAEANSVYYADKIFHRIWTVYDLKTIRELSLYFSELQHVYLADGHHRLLAAAKYRNMDSKTILESGNFISSFYLSSDQLRIKESYRVIIPAGEIFLDQVFRTMKRIFSVTKSQRNEPVIPVQEREFGLFMDGKWYRMVYKMKDKAGLPDACLLQQTVFEPLFKIENPETDEQVISVGGGSALNEIQQILADNPAAIAFTLAVINADQLMDIAHQGIKLPPKSTWVEPKIPFGLLLRKL